IEEIDAALGGLVQDGVALRLVALQPGGHGAEAKPGDAQAGAAEFDVLHGPILGRRPGKGQPAADLRVLASPIALTGSHAKFHNWTSTNLNRAADHAAVHFSGSE